MAITTSQATSINLGLAALPEVTDPKLFAEFVKVYNAIKILAQGLDTYTNDGAVASVAETVQDDPGVSVEILKRKLGVLTNNLEELITTHAELAELRKRYLKYTVPTFTVTTKFGCNGKSPQAAYPLTPITTTAPTGGVGTAAGGWDTAAHRDTAIATLQANTTAITEIQTALKNIGIGV